MASIDKPQILLWDLEVWEPDGPAIYSAMDMEKWEAETKFAILGKADTWSYLHVIEDDEARQVTVLAVVDVAAAKLQRDVATRIPQAGVWLWLSSAGTMRVIGSSRTLSREELATLVGGHSPPPSPTTIKSS